ncbi:MAG TPA: DNA repair exonuclease [bacterium]|nr:DNA repair exonuclease [bacterium]
MVKVLHTADIHLDMPFRWLGQQGEVRRRGLRQLFGRLCQTVKERADLLVLVGDIFEHEYVTPDTLNFIKKQLSALAPKKVFIAPGNHDPCLKDSPYLLEKWPENVHVFRTNTFETVPVPEHRLTVHGIANTAFQDNNRYLQNYRIPKDGNLHVVLFHGSDIQSMPPQYEQDAWFPFDEKDLLECGAHYVALGHYHSFRCIPSDEHNPKGCYPGCPECLDRSDSDDKIALLVEVSEAGNRIEKVLLAEYGNDQVTLDCKGVSTREEIEQKIQALAKAGNWSKKTVQVILRGEIDSGLDLRVDEIREAVRDVAFFLQIQDQTEFPYDLGQLASRRDALGEFVRRMKVQVEQGGLAEEDMRRTRLALLLGIDAFMRNEVRKP